MFLRKEYRWAALLLLLSAGVLLYLLPTPLFVDEDNHYGQIVDFLGGHLKISDGISMLPGYHFIMAVSLKTLGHHSVNFTRLVSTFYSLLTILLFYALARQQNPGQSLTKTLQCFFCPIVFPFLFLIYTDIFSLFWVLLSFYLVRMGKTNLSGLPILVGILVRQTNIVWSVFMVGYVYLERFGLTFKRENIVQVFRLTWTHFVVYGLFLIFTVINRGISTGQKELHPTMSFHMDNIFFMLIVFFFLFLPYHIQTLQAAIAQLKNKRALVALVSFFVFYMLTFQNSHPWNQSHLIFNPVNPTELQRAYPFLRNNLLAFIHSSIMLKALFFVPVVFSVLFLARNGRALVPYILMYFFTLVYLVPMWLIEPRYYIIPVVFFILLKEEQSTFIENLQTVYFAILAVVLMSGIADMEFFL